MKFFLLDPIVVTYKIMMKKKKGEFNPTPLEVPTTEIGTVVPILFGTRYIKNPSLVWYGDVNIKQQELDQGDKKK